MPFVYTHQEYADIVYVYGLCDGNATAAVLAYQARFPNRRIPSAQVFSRAYWQISQSGQLPSACVKKENAQRQEQAQVQDMIIDIVDENPRLSTRRIAAQLDVNHMKVWRTLHKECLYPYHDQGVQHLEPQDLAPRLNLCNWLTIEPQLVAKILFTDEATFTRNGITNFRNSHTWAYENPNAIRERHFQRRFSINVWCGMLNDRLIGPFLFDRNVTGEVYELFLRNELPGLLEDVPLAVRHDMYFQHDGHPAHFSLRVRNFLNEHFFNRWIGRGGPQAWPPRSPDLTPLDYYLWGDMKRMVYATEVDTREQLRNRIIAASELIKNSPRTIQSATNGLLRRAENCIAAQGGHFEQRQN